MVEVPELPKYNSRARDKLKFSLFPDITITRIGQINDIIGFIAYLAIYVGFALILIAFLIFAIFSYQLVSEFGFQFTELAYWAEGSPNSRSEVLRNIGLLIIGMLGIWFAMWRTRIADRNSQIARQQATVAEQGQITDRFAKAIELLSSGQIRSRIGGIHALQRIGRDSLFDREAVFRTLTDFVKNTPYLDEQERRHSFYTNGSENIKFPSETREIECPDVVLAFDALSTLSERNTYRETIELSDANLSYLNLRGTRFECMNLSRANFVGTVLSDTVFNRVQLSGALFDRCAFEGAKLQDVRLVACKFTHAVIEWTVNRIDLTAALFLDCESVEILGAGFDLSEAQIAPTIVSEISLSPQSTSELFGALREYD